LLQLEKRWGHENCDQDVIDALGGEKAAFKEVSRNEATGGILFDDATIDKYVEANPIPDSYDLGLETEYMEKMVRKYVDKAAKQKQKNKKIKAGKMRQQKVRSP